MASVLEKGFWKIREMALRIIEIHAHPEGKCVFKFKQLCIYLIIKVVEIFKFCVVARKL